MIYRKKLSRLAKHISFTEFNEIGDPDITSIVYDSRKAGEGTLFVALSGLHVDGHNYIQDAVLRGAAAVVAEHESAVKNISVPFFVVADSRAAMSKLSAALYDFPSEKMYVIGVTGTDGKTSTVWFIHQLLEKLGKKSGFLSTAAIQTGDEVIDNPFRQSTPESPEVHRVLAEMVANGKEFAVVEATSHGLSKKTMRLADVAFDAGVFTNIAHEHLEFHGTYDVYQSDKGNLFRSLKVHMSKPEGRRKFAVINKDSPAWQFFLDLTEVPVRTYGTENIQADVTAQNVTSTLSGSEFTVLYEDAQIPARLSIPGGFNIENALAAGLAVSGAAEISLPIVVDLFDSLTGVRGRMVRIDCGQPFYVFVDFAHTPQAFDKLFPMMKQATKGKLIVVFGSGGERDTAKRPMQGKAAAVCDFIILTDEDPRGENPIAILEEIEAGCIGKKRNEDLFLIPDRRQAIGNAFALAEDNDTVLLLGKGHEKGIIYKDKTVPWNEQAAAEELLSEMGFKKQT